MSNLAIKVGDVVMLKSGGPTMTVEWIEGDRAGCNWFAGTKPEFKDFPILSLKPAEVGGVI
jgi:uncharacterized protein YodC (DUF2158 family)